MTLGEGALRPGPRRLTRALIVEVAVALADAESVDAVSMGRLGRELGVTPMSMYRHVESKQDLNAAMAERVLEDLALPESVDPGTDWRAAARLVIYAWADLVERHPGSVRLIYTQRPATHKDMLPAELFASAALTSGFSASEAALAYRTIVLFVDSVLLTTGMSAGAGMTDWQSLPPDLTRSLPSMRAIASHVDRLTYREIFDRGVEFLLAGIAADREATPGSRTDRRHPDRAPVPSEGAKGAELRTEFG